MLSKIENNMYLYRNLDGGWKNKIKIAPGAECQNIKPGSWL